MDPTPHDFVRLFDLLMEKLDKCSDEAFIKICSLPEGFSSEKSKMTKDAYRALTVSRLLDTLQPCDRKFFLDVYDEVQVVEQYKEKWPTSEASERTMPVEAEDTASSSQGKEQYRSRKERKGRKEQYRLGKEPNGHKVRHRSGKEPIGYELHETSIHNEKVGRTTLMHRDSICSHHVRSSRTHERIGPKPRKHRSETYDVIEKTKNQNQSTKKNTTDDQEKSAHIKNKGESTGIEDMDLGSEEEDAGQSIIVSSQSATKRVHLASNIAARMPYTAPMASTSGTYPFYTPAVCFPGQPVYFPRPAVGSIGRGISVPVPAPYPLYPIGVPQPMAYVRPVQFNDMSFLRYPPPGIVPVMPSTQYVCPVSELMVIGTQTTAGAPVSSEQPS
uniref:Uncharacterized protein n=1 Tax=Trichuris muris TaxID=70415 RepID=A0A5S6QE80_TRIMR